MGVPSWSLSAALNAVADPLIRAVDSAAARSFPASLRALMAGVRGLSDDRGGALATGGSANAYTVTTAGGITELRPGLSLLLRVDRTNTDEPTLNVDGLGPRPWRDQGGAAIVAGGLTKGMFRLVVWDDALKAWISELPPPAAKPMPPASLKGNLLASEAQAQDLTLASLTQPGNPLGEAILERLERALVPAKQLSGPFPTPALHRVVTDPLRHAWGNYVEFSNGRCALLYKSSHSHLPDYEAELRGLITIDDGNTISGEEVTLAGPDGKNKSADCVYEMPDGTYAMITEARREDATQNETPEVYYISSDFTVTGPVKLAFADGSALTPLGGMVPYWLGEYRAGGPSARQVICYYAGDIWRSVYVGGTWGPLVKIIARAANMILSEGAIGYAPDGRGYMLIRNLLTTNDGFETRKLMLASFSTVVNGTEVWGTPVFTAMTCSSAPPYLLPYKPSQHYFYTRSARGSNTSDFSRAQLVAVEINPLAFILSRGQAGFDLAPAGATAWQARMSLSDWVHIQGGWTKLRESTDERPSFALCLSESEGFKPPTSHGSPCQMVIVTNRASPSLSAAMVQRLMSSNVGRPESFNSEMQVWTFGTEKRSHVDLTKRLMGPDGHSVRRSGNVGGSYVEGYGDGDQLAFRWGRESGDTSTASMNLTGAIFGASIRHLRGQYLSFCFSALAGPNWSCQDGTLLIQVLGGTNANARIVGSDGNVSGLVSLYEGANPFVRTMRLSKTRYTEVDPTNVYIPKDIEFISYLVTWRPLANPAPAGDTIIVRRAGFFFGDRKPIHKIRPFLDDKEQCERILAGTYIPGIVPGTATPNGALTNRIVSDQVRGGYVDWELPSRMLRTPDFIPFASATGTRGKLSVGTNDLDVAIFNQSDKRATFAPSGPVGPGTAFSLHALASACPWDI